MTDSQGEPDAQRPEGAAAQPLRGSTLVITNVTKLAGVGLAVYEVLKFGHQADDAVILFCAVCVVGAQAVENALLRFIDRMFGPGQGGP